MQPLPKEDLVNLEKLMKSILGRPDPLGRILAKMLIERGIITVEELAEKLWAEGKIERASLEGKSHNRFVDTKGKLWTKSTK
ncbi:MAG TPA: hypothetical protein VGR30_10665 [Candidatus Binatia bacterium]|jgi:hypothetical protein|nr:hypothetical protein [Candidatus Binatia bacterium]